MPEDAAEAVRWYRLAADQGYAAAQYNLGIMYASGLGVPLDYVQEYGNVSTVASSNASPANGTKRTRGTDFRLNFVEDSTPRRYAIVGCHDQGKR